MNYRVFRQGLCVGLFLTIIAVAIAGCGSSTAGAGSNSAGATSATITLYASGDVNVQNLWRNTLIPQFEKAYPNLKVKLVFAEHGTTDAATLARLTAAVQAKQSPGMDLIDASMVTQAAAANLLQPLTAKEIPLIGHVDSNLLKSVNNEAIPYRASSVVLGYNSDKVQSPPTTLDDLIAWIKANPGKFTYNQPSTGGSGQAFVEAVLNKYVNAGDLTTFETGYSSSLEGQWQQGFQALKSLGPSIYNHGFYPNGNAAVLQLLGNGSIEMAPVWSDMSLSYMAQNLLPASTKLVQLSPPFNGGPAYMGIPKNAPHAQAAETLLNWLLNSNVQATIVAKMNGFPGVQWSYLPASVQQQFAPIAKSYGTFYSSKFTADMNKQWQSQVAGG
jgi:putative spermidine/putrescine transport system substrate-binding protein